ncbi:hypothetical protein FA95DRAFT_1608094 [Auriscalpium vulgare]|uniref:Uncharacterized protein n=1 Tax=Auriscalpium vulgare TaxID=40419 RepID=A0ACB8RM43_9AGAM|nr:hypothetical protein FA95DRAFT_1608094 [Auriscalpium vulgare]
MVSPLVPSLLLFVSPFTYLALLVLQVARKRRASSWATRQSLGSGRTIAALFTTSIAALSLVSGVLGTVAHETGGAGCSVSSPVRVAHQVTLTVLKFDLGLAVSFLLHQRALIEASTFSPTSRASFWIKVLNVILALVLVGATVLSIAFIALKQTYPISRIADVLWLVFISSTFCIVGGLFIRCRKSGRIARLWLLLALSLIWALLSTVISTLDDPPPGIPESVCTACWTVCTILAFHAYAALAPAPAPDRPPSRSHTPSGLAPRRAGTRSPRAFSRPLSPNSHMSEDFRTLHDPFAPTPGTLFPVPGNRAGIPEPSPSPLSPRGRRHARRNKARSTVFTQNGRADAPQGNRFRSASQSSAGDLILSQMLLRVLEDGSVSVPRSVPRSTPLARG